MSTWESLRLDKLTKVHIPSVGYASDLQKLYPITARRQTNPHRHTKNDRGRKPLFRMMFMECISLRLAAAPPSPRIQISRCIRCETLPLTGRNHHHRQLGSETLPDLKSSRDRANTAHSRSLLSSPRPRKKFSNTSDDKRIFAKAFPHG